MQGVGGGCGWRYEWGGGAYLGLFERLDELSVVEDVARAVGQLVEQRIFGWVDGEGWEEGEGWCHTCGCVCEREGEGRRRTLELWLSIGSILV